MSNSYIESDNTIHSLPRVWTSEPIENADFVVIQLLSLGKNAVESIVYVVVCADDFLLL